MPSSPSPDQIASQSPAAMTVPEFCRWARLGRTATYREVAAKRLVLRKCGSKSLSELRRRNLIEPTERRRVNASGMRAICWRAKASNMLSEVV